MLGMERCEVGCRLDPAADFSAPFRIKAERVNGKLDASSYEGQSWREDFGKIVPGWTERDMRAAAHAKAALPVSEEQWHYERLQHEGGGACRVDGKRVLT